MFKVGDKLLIRTVTSYQLGEVAKVGKDGWLKLENASWVADTGRFHTALETGQLNEVEYVGGSSETRSASRQAGLRK